VVSKDEVSNFLKSMDFEHSPADLDEAFAAGGDASRSEIDLLFFKEQVWTSTCSF
jgi:flagellar biosynthesis regulator FlaF